MTKKNFVALADSIRTHNQIAKHTGFLPFTQEQVISLADFCKAQNGNFDRDRWLNYVAGNCGKNGGAIKPVKRNGEWNGVNATSVPMRDRLPNGSLAGMPIKKGSR